MLYSPRAYFESFALFELINYGIVSICTYSGLKLTYNAGGGVKCDQHADPQAQVDDNNLVCRFLQKFEFWMHILIDDDTYLLRYYINIFFPLSVGDGSRPPPPPKPVIDHRF